MQPILHVLYGVRLRDGERIMIPRNSITKKLLGREVQELAVGRYQGAFTPWRSFTHPHPACVNAARGAGIYTWQGKRGIRNRQQQETSQIAPVTVIAQNKSSESNKTFEVVRRQRISSAHIRQISLITTSTLFSSKTLETRILRRSLGRVCGVLYSCHPTRKCYLDFLNQNRAISRYYIQSQR